MNKLGIFINFWEKNWDCDHAKYIKKASDLGFDVLEFQAQALLEMSKERMTELKKMADDKNIEHDDENNFYEEDIKEENEKGQNFFSKLSKMYNSFFA